MKLYVSTQAKLEQVAADALFDTLSALGDDADGREGVLFTIARCIDPTEGLRGWRQVDRFKVGKREGDDWEMPETFVAEKDLRLRKRYTKNSELSSDQSRNPDLYELGGAIILRAYVTELGGDTILLLSASGLPDKRRADEAFLLRLVQLMGWGDGEQYAKIVAMSKNSLAAQLIL